MLDRLPNERASAADRERRAAELIGRARELDPADRPRRRPHRTRAAHSGRRARCAARGAAVPPADPALLRRRGGRAGHPVPGDRGDRAGRRQRRLVHRPGLGRLDDGGLCQTGGRPHRVRRQARGGGHRAEQPQGQGARLRRRLSRHRRMGLRQRLPARGVAVWDMPRSASPTASRGSGRTASRWSCAR